jgi:ABC-type transport system substrate-binding protein
VTNQWYACDRETSTFCDPEVEAAIEAIGSIEDEAEVGPAWAEVQRIVHDKAAMLWLTVPEAALALSSEDITGELYPTVGQAMYFKEWSLA